MLKHTNSKKWTCDICHQTFNTKRSLCEDLAIHFEDSTTEADEAMYQLEDLGVKDHTKYL